MSRILRRALILAHRYLGTVLSLLFLMWFLTGIGMIYSRGMPRLTPETRLARLQPLELDRVLLSPSQAAERVGLSGPGLEATLLTVMDRPAYRFARRGSETVFADTGERLGELSLEEAIRIASRFLDVEPERIRYRETLVGPDQWTLTQGRELPMYKLEVADESGTDVYVSARLGEVVQLTTRRGRLLAWVSVIPHFLYFQALRMNNDLWNATMVWGSGIGALVAALGILLGWLHFRPSRPVRLSKISEFSPYRGWLRWHHWSGLVFGVLTVTFAASGLLSMEPWEWAARDASLAAHTAAAFPDGSAPMSNYPAIDAESWAERLGDRQVKEIELARVFDRPYFVVRGAPSAPARMGWPDGGHQPYYVERSVDAERIVVSADTLEPRDSPFPEEAILDRLRDELPDVPVLRTDRLAEYDSYYYSREGRSPLPVLRVQLGDPDRTWLYIDPEVGRVVGRINHVNRVERWLYAAVHTFDFPFLYQRRPLWDILLIVVCLGGALVSGIGAWLGAKRIGRSLDRLTEPGRS